MREAQDGPASFIYPFSFEFRMTGILYFQVLQTSTFSISSVMKWATFDRVVGRPVKIPVMGDSQTSYADTSASINESGRTLHHSM